jgi:CDP-diacylglycerol--inositol 3-phosphatidyltransferase
MGENVYLFIPNLIGYGRILLGVTSFYFMLHRPWLTVSLYLCNVTLDEVDGRAARRYNQCTKFGGLLDMITDKMNTACMLAVLGYFYPSSMFIFQLLMIIDISSHWCASYSAALHSKSHKDQDTSVHLLVRFYYIPSVLSVFCATTELFLAALYMLHFTPGTLLHIFGYEVGAWMVVALVTFPFQFLKQCIYLLQLIAACQNIAALDSREREHNSTHNH